MDQRKALLKQLRAFRKRVNQDFPIHKLYLFGSYAAGKPHRDSDVDLIIVSQKFQALDFVQRGSQMYHYRNFNYPADFLCYTPKEFEQKKKTATIIRQAVEDGIEIK